MGVSLDTGAQAAPPSPLPPLHLGTDRGLGHRLPSPSVPATVTLLYVSRGVRAFRTHSHRVRVGWPAFSGQPTTTTPPTQQSAWLPRGENPGTRAGTPVHATRSTTSLPTLTRSSPSPHAPHTIIPPAGLRPSLIALRHHPPGTPPTARLSPLGTNPLHTHFSNTPPSLSHNCHYSAHHTVRDIARVFTGYTFWVYIGCNRPCVLSE